MSMSRDQCREAFPKMFVDVDRTKLEYENFKIIADDLDEIELSEGRVRAAISAGKVGTSCYYSRAAYIN